MVEILSEKLCRRVFYLVILPHLERMTTQHSKFMREALEEAQLAFNAGEVPVGAIVTIDGQIVARAHNEVERNNDASAHAEILALRRAGLALNSWRLDAATLYVTLEPCTMCIGALSLARVDSIYFGAWDQRQGAAGSIYDLSQHPSLPHNINVVPELLQSESAALLKEFFSQCRNRAL